VGAHVLYRLTTFIRLLSAEDELRCDCAALEQALGMLPGARRMVVGHTIQEAGINSACGDRVFRIDVGLSKGCGDGDPQVRHLSQCLLIWVQAIGRDQERHAEMSGSDDKKALARAWVCPVSFLQIGFHLEITLIFFKLIKC
jgi:hypothetical protein